MVFPCFCVTPPIVYFSEVADIFEYFSTILFVNQIQKFISELKKFKVGDLQKAVKEEVDQAMADMKSNMKELMEEFKKSGKIKMSFCRAGSMWITYDDNKNFGKVIDEMGIMKFEN